MHLSFSMELQVHAALTHTLIFKGPFRLSTVFVQTQTWVSLRAGGSRVETFSAGTWGQRSLKSDDLSIMKTPSKPGTGDLKPIITPRNKRSLFNTGQRRKL
jgi:hypothetical protein